MQVVGFLLTLLIFINSSKVNGIYFENNGYFDVLVAISPDIEIEDIDKKLIVENTKVCLSYLNFQDKCSPIIIISNVSVLFTVLSIILFCRNGFQLEVRNFIQPQTKKHMWHR